MIRRTSGRNIPSENNVIIEKNGGHMRNISAKMQGTAGQWT